MSHHRQFDQIRHVIRTEGVRAAISRVAWNVSRPIFYRDHFYATRIDIHHSTRPRTPDSGPNTVRRTLVGSVAELDTERSLMHRDLDYGTVATFLSKQADTRRVAFLRTLTLADGRRVHIGYSIHEQGRFCIESYDYCGALPQNFVMTSDSEVVPEFRGTGLGRQSISDAYNYWESLGIDTVVGVIRRHNVASLRSAFKPRPGRVNSIKGEFTITTMLGGLVVRKPEWATVEAMLLGPATMTTLPPHASRSRRKRTEARE